MPSRNTFPTPPRLTGKAQNDLVAFAAWVNDFYRAAFIDGAFATPQDVTDAVDPANATAGTAQSTANAAQAAANAAQDELDAMDAGAFTVSGASTTATVTLTAPQADTAYYVVCTAVATTGTPGVNACVVIGAAKTVNDFVVTLGTAPGVGNSVTFNWHLRR